MLLIVLDAAVEVQIVIKLPVQATAAAIATGMKLLVAQEAPTAAAGVATVTKLLMQVAAAAAAGIQIATEL